MIHDLTINLYNVPFDKSYSNLFNFSTKAELFTYFNNNFLITSVSNMNYQRKDGYCMIEKTMQELQKVNYISYFVDGMRYFAFVDNKSFVNPRTTRLELTTDLFHTFFEHFEYPVCYIERRIENTDYLYSNLVPENNFSLDLKIFETLRSYGKRKHNGSDEFLLYASAYSKDLLNKDESENVKTFDNCGFKHFTQVYSSSESGLESGINRYLRKVVEDDVVTYDYPNLVGVYQIPWDFSYKRVHGGTYDISEPLNNIPLKIEDDDFTLPSSFREKNDVFTPKNNKLLSPLFRKMILYKGNENSYTEIDYSLKTLSGDFNTVRVSKYCFFGDVNPVIGIEFWNLEGSPVFTYDSFYTTRPNTMGNPQEMQNLINQKNNAMLGGIISTMTTAMGVAAAPATGGASIIAAAGGITSLYNIGKDIEQMDISIDNMKSTSTNNVISGDFNNVMLSNSRDIFNIFTAQPENKTLEIVDDYFTHYGYAQNNFSSPTPSYSTRPRFYYVKTKGCKINCSYLSSGELSTIENAFNKGIHFWKDKIYNYDDNEVV